jgi:hypothetical protein
MNGENAVRRFRERLGLLYFLRWSAIGLAAWCLVYGAAVLALRAAFELDRGLLLWGMASLPLVVFGAAWHAWRSLPSADRVRALVDGHGRCGGLVMASAEVPLGGWKPRDPEPPLPRWNATPTLTWCAVGPLFLAAAFLAPASFVRGEGGGALDIRRDVERLAEQIKALKEEEVLSAERADALAARLEELRKEASGRDPVKTLEALDHLQDTLNKAAQKEAEAAARHVEDLGKAETLAEALEKNAGRLDEAQLAQALSALASLARKAAEENDLLAGEIDPALLDELAKGKKLSPEQAKKLAEAFKKGKSEALKKAAKLVKARLIDPEALEKCEGASKADLAALADYLKENGFDGTDNLLGDGMSEEGGKGGVSRGPGAVKLTFGDESSDSGVTFKEEELPPSELQKIRDSELQGVSSGAPTVNKGGTGKASSGALSSAEAGGGASAAQTVLPKHKAAVERFFNRTMPRPR